MQENRKVESGYSCLAMSLNINNDEPEQEHFNFWYGLRAHSERLDDETKKKILSIAPYKMMLYDATINP